MGYDLEPLVTLETKKRVMKEIREGGWTLIFQHDATMLARLVLEWDCPSIVENPVSVLATTWKKPTGL